MWTPEAGTNQQLSSLLVRTAASEQSSLEPVCISAAASESAVGGLPLVSWPVSLVLMGGAAYASGPCRKVWC